jgi:hypothetical protein
MPVRANYRLADLNAQERRIGRFSTEIMAVVLRNSAPSEREPTCLLSLIVVTGITAEL